MSDNQSHIFSLSSMSRTSNDFGWPLLVIRLPEIKNPTPEKQTAPSM